MGERVIGYARISVAHEDINNQISAIEKYCEEKGYELLTVLQDTVTGVSNPLDRPEFRKLVEYCNNLGINKVIVYDLSRLGRNIGELHTALKILDNNGVIVEFVRHPELANMNETSFEVFVIAMGLAAQLERESMRQRLEAARRSGKRIGRPPVEIPIDTVKKYLEKGLSKKDVYRLLVGQGLLRDRKGRVLTYVHFIRRLKEEGL